MNEDCFHLGVKAIIRNKDGKILLLKVNPAYLKDYKGEPYWDIPGGRIQRESSIEETGITEIKSFTPFSMVLSNNIRIPVAGGTVGLILSSYICEVDNVSNILLSKEHTEFGWFKPVEKIAELA